MRISARAVYASMAVLELALHGDQNPIQAKEIAIRQDIPIKFLEQILVQLKNAGIAASTRGSAGGYRLNRPVEELSLREIIEAVDGELAIVDIQCADPILGQAWSEMQDRILGVLRDFKLSELVARKQIESQSWDFQI